MEPVEALCNLSEFQKCIHLLEENASVSQRLYDLVRQHLFKGKGIHDANIAATMTLHGLVKLLTFNGKDYKKFAGLAILDPSEQSSW